MKKFFVFLSAIALVSIVAFSSSVYAQNQGISEENAISTENEEGKVKPRAVPAVAAAGRAAAQGAKQAWKAVPKQDKQMMTQAAKDAVGLGGIDNSEKNKSELVFD
ncbi:hypothetical protein RM578_11715 [Staphylococcus haemolyticus]|uniref:hypothetical protein n=1 Tax=Staphylococcus haemolyticus TaxID=1283 RepID=UPI002885F2B3|nr:hypothetical protein [Staphylococcus haemolyticus]MDT0739104.1 hypothetical protein [Staphylococcus haemolyticus]